VELKAGILLGGRFVLERRLGEGGMGVVWAARHAVTRKAVAIKMLKPERASDAVVRERFVREARTASKVQHPNIIEIRDVIELDDGAPAMVMDLLEGETLGDVVEREGALPLSRVAPIMVQVLSAVGTAHAAGVVHRDLKPDNIFLVRVPGADGDRVSVRVLDFGIAKVVSTDGAEDVSRGLTNTGALLGTPYYMAPEQLFGERRIDARADVWALGVILYECLSGRRPTEAENLGQILRIITDDKIVPLATAAPSLPGDVLQLVARMLLRDRNERPGSLVEAFEVMSAHARGEPARPFSAPRAPTEILEAPRPDSTRPRAVIPSDGDAVPTAATLASTTQSTTTDRVLRDARRAGRAMPFAIAAVVVGVLAALVVAVTRGPTVPGSSSAAASTPTPPSAPASTAAVLSAPVPAPTAPTVLADPSPAPSASGGAVVGKVVPARPPPPRATSTPSPPAPSPAASTPPHSNPSPYDHL
jgi:serine/threonine-protein kinase